MKNNSATPGSTVKPGDRTDWQRVVGQSEAEIEHKSSTDPDAPVLTGKKYYKPEKMNQNQQ